MKHYELDAAEEREHIRKAIASLQHSVGARPLGWYCRYGPSVNTRRLLVEEGGFLYDSDAYNDELPYWVVVNDRPHLVVPYTLGVNDSKFGRGVFATAEDFFTYARDGFDMLYREGASQPKMMSVGLHMRLIGHPSRAVGSGALPGSHGPPRRVGLSARGNRPALDAAPSLCSLRGQG